MIKKFSLNYQNLKKFNINLILSIKLMKFSIVIFLAAITLLNVANGQLNAQTQERSLEYCDSNCAECD